MAKNDSSSSARPSVEHASRGHLKAIHPLSALAKYSSLVSGGSVLMSTTLHLQDGRPSPCSRLVVRAQRAHMRLAGHKPVEVAVRCALAGRGVGHRGADRGKPKTNNKHRAPQQRHENGVVHVAIRTSFPTGCAAISRQPHLKRQVQPPNPHPRGPPALTWTKTWRCP